MGLGVVVFLVLLRLSGLDGSSNSGAAPPLAFDANAVGMLPLKEVRDAMALGTSIPQRTGPAARQRQENSSLSSRY
jgi:hypothetical protein